MGRVETEEAGYLARIEEIFSSSVLSLNTISSSSFFASLWAIEDSLGYKLQKVKAYDFLSFEEKKFVNRLLENKCLDI